MAETLKSTRTKTTKKASTRKKVVRRKTAAGQAKTRGVGAGTVNETERRRMIAEAAYYRAAHRDFVGGDPHQDWLEAEADIDSRLAAAVKSVKTAKKRGT